MPQIKRCKKCADHGISDDGRLILLRFPPLRAWVVRSQIDGIDSYVLPRYGQAFEPALWHLPPMPA